MSLATALSAYLNLNLLVIVGFCAVFGFTFFIRAIGSRVSAKNELQLHYLVLASIFVFALCQPLLPSHETFEPAARMWSAPSIENFNENYNSGNGNGFVSVPTPLGESTIQSQSLVIGWSLLGICLFFVAVGILSRDLRALIRIKRNSFRIRKIGRVQVLINDSLQVPISFWFPGQASIVVPSYLTADPEAFKIATVHEIQHHRHGDTRWLYLLLALKFLCVANPLIYIWNRKITEIQEFACDETLVDRNKVKSQAYARCLVEVAQSALAREPKPFCATGFIFSGESHLLKRRIENMFSRTKSPLKHSISVFAGLTIAALVGATAFASKSFVQDRRISMAEAEKLAEKARANSPDFPIVVNDLVLKQLNRYIGTPEGREFVRKALRRMESYKPMIEAALLRYNVPEEIMAMPIVESGYKNLPQSPHPMKSAGLWQFIPQTARNYGLQVDDVKDERLDPTILTDAAMRYLQSNRHRFKDWLLAIHSYNMGEDAVQKAINKTGSRDVWTLIRKGYEGDNDYSSRVMAAVIILKNPESVE